jgi:hypothetical protein
MPIMKIVALQLSPSTHAPVATVEGRRAEKPAKSVVRVEHHEHASWQPLRR